MREKPELQVCCEQVLERDEPDADGRVAVRCRQCGLSGWLNREGVAADEDEIPYLL